MLGDLGAEVTKVERPQVGDDTRGFAPPFLPGAAQDISFRLFSQFEFTISVVS